MIIGKAEKCPLCGGGLKRYDRVKRKTIGPFRKIGFVYILRYKCTKCGKLHRCLSKNIPYKHYESEIIFGVIDRKITYYTYGFEDYPCELTMKNWVKNSASINVFRTT